MKIRTSISWQLVILFFMIQTTGWATSWKISSVKDFETVAPQLMEKDSVIWKNGSYADVVINLKNNGIIFMAETPGKVIFTGKSSVRISADNVTFSGFQFLDGSVSGNVVTVAGSRCRISQLNISGYRSHYFFEITKTGRFNDVAWCNFEKKPQALPGKEGTSVFQVAVDSLHPGNNVIRWCSFRDFQAPEGAGGDYGMEAFRPGYSYQSKFVSRTLMEYCYFTRCKGDGEIISNKARENVYRYNTFESNGESHVTLRHGSNTAVYGNFFLDGAGIRIKEGQNDMVYNNYFNTGNYFSIRLENYRVDPLRNILIAHNTLVGSGPVRLGGKGEYPPEEVVICNNLVVQPTAKILEDPTGRETMINNYTSELPAEKGFILLKKLPVTNEYGFIRPQKALPSVKIPRQAIMDIQDMEDDPEILFDIVKNKRGKNKSSGCFEPVRNDFPVKPVATAFNTGPSYLQINP
ncbi:MAG TPA: chondroitinase-B domain-containing protein [Prolixibacteraceae bacterium]|nr:chondroitinase-B domain-containing protein [Prolixibacteraceae bacterium]